MFFKLKLFLLAWKLVLRAARAVPDSVPAAVSASAATLGTAAACGWIENRSAVAPLNAIAHVFRGEEAFSEEASTLTPRTLARYTLPAIVWNTFALWGWAIGHEFVSQRARGGNLGRSLATGALTSLVAYVIDYKVVGPRWTPGIEVPLSKRSLLLTYVALALGLALASKKR